MGQFSAGSINKVSRVLSVRIYGVCAVLSSCDNFDNVSSLGCHD